MFANFSPRIKKSKSIESREQYCNITNENDLFTLVEGKVFHFNHFNHFVQFPKNIQIMKARMIENLPDSKIIIYENYDNQINKSFNPTLESNYKSFDDDLQTDKCGNITNEKIYDVRKLFKFMKPMMQIH